MEPSYPYPERATSESIEGGKPHPTTISHHDYHAPSSSTSSSFHSHSPILGGTSSAKANGASYPSSPHQSSHPPLNGNHSYYSHPNSGASSPPANHNEAYPTHQSLSSTSLASSSHSYLAHPASSHGDQHASNEAQPPSQTGHSPSSSAHISQHQTIPGATGPSPHYSRYSTTAPPTSSEHYAPSSSHNYTSSYSHAPQTTHHTSYPSSSAHHHQSQPYPRGPSSSSYYPVPYQDLSSSYTLLYKKYKKLQKDFKKAERTVLRLRHERKILNDLLADTGAIKRLVQGSDVEEGDEEDDEFSPRKRHRPSGDDADAMDEDEEQDNEEDHEEEKDQDEEDDDEIGDDHENDTAEDLLGRKLPRALMDPRAPKRPPNPYMIFAEAERESMKAEREKRTRTGTTDPDEDLGNIPKALGARWKALSSAEREEYKKIYQVNMEEYEKQMTKFLKEHPEVLKQYKKIKSEKRKSSKQKPVPSTYAGKEIPPRRPPNPYFVFCVTEKARLKVHKEHLLREDPNSQEAAEMGNLTKALGASWRKLTAAERKPYQEEYRKQIERYKNWFYERGLEPPPYRPVTSTKKSKTKGKGKEAIGIVSSQDPLFQRSLPEDLEDDEDIDEEEEEQIDEEVDELEEEASGDEDNDDGDDDEGDAAVLGSREEIGDAGTDGTDDEAQDMTDE